MGLNKPKKLHCYLAMLRNAYNTPYSKDERATFKELSDCIHDDLTILFLVPTLEIQTIQQALFRLFSFPIDVCWVILLQETVTYPEFFLHYHYLLGTELLNRVQHQMKGNMYAVDKKQYVILEPTMYPSLLLFVNT